MQLPIQIPFQKELLEHQKQFPKCESFTIYGTTKTKREKLKGLYCKTCKKFVSTIQILSSKKRRVVN